MRAERIIWWILGGLFLIVTGLAGAWGNTMHSDIESCKTMNANQSERISRVEATIEYVADQTEKMNAKLDRLIERGK